MCVIRRDGEGPLSNPRSNPLFPTHFPTHLRKISSSEPEIILEMEEAAHDSTPPSEPARFASSRFFCRICMHRCVKHVPGPDQTRPVCCVVVRVYACGCPNQQTRPETRPSKTAQQTSPKPDGIRNAYPLHAHSIGNLFPTNKSLPVPVLGMRSYRVAAVVPSCVWCRPAARR